jgi:hypothetical protein
MRSAGDGREEIHQRWSKRGDLPETGHGEDSRRPAGVPGGGCAVASPRKKKKTTPPFLFFLFFYFFIGPTSGTLSISAQIKKIGSSALTGGSHLLDSVSIRVQLVISENCKKNRKVVVFCD